MEMQSSAVSPRSSSAKLLVPLLVGAAVAVGLGIYGNEHDPTGESIFSLVFTKTINMKAWFASAAGVLALLQLASALRMYRVIRVPRTMPRWLPLAHRFSGAAIFALVVPVAYHCLWALGFQDYSTRVVVHSIAGCFFFGAFAAKVVVVESKRLPRLALPVAGGLLFSAFVVVWYTSALWFFREFGFPSF
jgi:Family of unknown function (DUF6529)